jgi:agmatine deiminase
MKSPFHHFAALLLCLFLAHQAFAQPSSEVKSRRQPIREVTLTGAGYELCLQHGQIFKKEIAELVAKYKRVEFSDKPGPQEPASIHYYTQGNANRTAAEWEPAKGTMITWPLCIPYKLAVELSKDKHLYTLVDNDADRLEAIKWYTKWGIDADNNTFVFAPQGIDAWWTRDWGPSAVFTPDGTMKLGDGKYIYATPVSGLECSDSLQFYRDKDRNIVKTETDDNATVPVGKGLNIPVLDLPFANTGGNVITDGLGTAFSSCILLNENRFSQVPADTFFRLNQSLLGFRNYHILPNFEKRGIQHIDCLMKLLDENRILVAEPPGDHEMYPVYQNIVENELKKLKNSYGQPYQILRIKIGRYDQELLAAYTNSIIINKIIYVPLFQIKEDIEALETWRKAMPGYTVKGFTFALKDEPIVSDKLKKHYNNYGWNYGDALHCRTRAVWDSEMLYITVRRLPAKVATNEPLTVYVTMIDYSKKGLKPGSPKLHWRLTGKQKWNEVPLKTAENSTHFSASIPTKATHGTIEYYISAASTSGRRETMPRTAPAGFYSVER